jgi:hypothetical protein
MPLLVIGHAANPLSFRRQPAPPIFYKNNKSAWMTSKIFTDFFLEWDYQLQQEERFVLVVIDNCPSHPKQLKQQLFNIKLVFLPPNTTSVLQPLDQGIIQNIKQSYRKKLVKDMISSLEKNEIYRPINLYAAVNLLAECWDEVTDLCIKNCFAKAGWNDQTVVEQLDDSTIDGYDQLGDVESFDTFVAFDDGLRFFEPYTMGEISNIVNQDHLPVELEVPEESEDPLETANELESMILSEDFDQAIALEIIVRLKNQIRGMK